METQQNNSKQKKVGPKYIELDLVTIRTLAAQGLTNQQICDSIGIGKSKFYDEMNGGDSELADALKLGRAQGLAAVSNALFQNAVKGNFSAQRFYLRARDPENWNDDPEIKLEGGTPFSILLTDPSADEHGDYSSEDVRDSGDVPHRLLLEQEDEG